jgi:hypothetical protein
MASAAPLEFIPPQLDGRVVAGARLLLARSSELLATGAQEFHSQLTPAGEGPRP